MILNTIPVGRPLTVAFDWGINMIAAMRPFGAWQPHLLKYTMADKVVAIFIASDTEVEFYKKIVSIIRELNEEKLSYVVKQKSMKGIGNYKNHAVNYFKIIKEEISRLIYSRTTML